MREGLERSLTHASARKDRERPCLVSLARRGWDISRSQGKQKERERTHDEDEVNRRPFSSIVRDTRAYEHEENWKNHGGSFARHTAADSFLAPVTRVSYRQSQKKKVSREWSSVRTRSDRQRRGQRVALIFNIDAGKKKWSGAANDLDLRVAIFLFLSLSFPFLPRSTDASSSHLWISFDAGFSTTEEGKKTGYSLGDD